uniref:F-box domain-containing protein n=1 Tax=Globodera pallida TaxID=36090 RepID=A0A183BJP9_GLOPA
MSDNLSDEKQQQKMKEISICADVWLEIFALVSPFELGHLMALISDRFDALVDEHFKLRKWSLGSLQILRTIEGNGAEIVIKRSSELLPIPQGPIPKKVIGFEEIKISYVDQPVIEFLQRIRRLFNSSGTNVWMDTSDNQSRSWEIIRQNIWPLVKDNICGLGWSFFEINRLRQRFSPAILRNCANLRSIISFGLFASFPDNDNAGGAVVKWLTTPRGDGLPKILRCYFPAGMDVLKRAFVNASEPVNYIINFWNIVNYFVPFELKNNLTAERLTLRQMEDNWMLVRCPIGRKEDKWAKWEEEAIGWGCCRQSNRITIDFEDGDIGDGLVDENDEGPSEPKK